MRTTEKTAAGYREESCGLRERKFRTIEREVADYEKEKLRTTEKKVADYAKESGGLQRGKF